MAQPNARRSKAALNEERELTEYFWHWTFETPANFQQELRYLLQGYYHAVHAEALRAIQPDGRRKVPAALVAILAKAWRVPPQKIGVRFNELQWNEQQRFNSLVNAVVDEERPNLVEEIAAALQNRIPRT